MPRGDTAIATALPHNIEAEQAFLAALLLQNRIYDKVAGILRPEHFATGVHGRIYAACADLIDKGKPANPVTLRSLFDQDEALKDEGGYRYLTKLAVNVVTIVNAEDYARQIVDLAKRRAAIAVFTAGIARAGEFDLAVGAGDIIREAEQALYEIGEETGQGAGAVSAGDSANRAIALADAAHKRGGRILGVTTGLADLDNLLGGLLPGQLVVLAGRPAMGKTTLASCISVAAARAFGEAGALAVLEFELEMTAAEMGGRRLAAVTSLDGDHITKGRLSNHDFVRLCSARDELARLPLYTDDTPTLSLTEIRSRARRMKRQRGLGLIMVDHIGLVRPSPEARRNGETAAITEITAALKALAKDMNCPVLALSQLNRDLEKRDDKRPMLADLRQSGSIEQDADVVLFVYREEYYLSRSEPMRKAGEKDDVFNIRFADWETRRGQAQNKADIIVAKHRNGPCGTVHSFFDGARGVFQNLSQGQMTV